MLVLVASPALSWAAPAKHRGQYASADTVHLANQGGAINHRLDYEVTLVIDGGKATLLETGASHEHNLFPDHSTDDDITWTGTWAGTAKQTGATLVLELAQTSRPCTHVRKSTGMADVIKPCKPATKTARFECTADSVRLEARGTPTRAVWRCQLATGELPIAGASWVAGKTACVRTLGSRRGGGARHEPCTKPAP